MKVTKKEALEVRVERVLRERGLDTLSCHDEWIRLMISRKVRTCLFFWETAYYQIGSLYMKCPSIGANPQKNWVIKVLGQEHYEPMEVLAKSLAEQFGVDIHVELKSLEEVRL
ncbi:MAG: hypothetical protein QG653_438 [Patescibacteria group bacterium]|nr:hypothetical protein [Patescibacteria group bacterium]